MNNLDKPSFSVYEGFALIENRLCSWDMKWIQTGEKVWLWIMSKQWGLAGYDLEIFSEMPYKMWKKS